MTRQERHVAAVAALQRVAARQLDEWLADASLDKVEAEACIIDALANATISVAVALGSHCPNCIAASLARACVSTRIYSQQAQLRCLPAEGSA